MSEANVVRLVAVVALLGGVGAGCGGRAYPVYPRDAGGDADAKEAAEAPPEAPAMEVASAGESPDALVPGVETGADAPVGAGDVGSSPDVAEAPQEAGAADARDAPLGTAALGKLCQRSYDCASGHCQEGVCCDATCTGTCQSCLTTNTGKPDGTCAPVKAGQPHGTDCTAADPTTCGLDGKCDGAGACRRHVAGTICAAEACTDGVALSTYSPARGCDGKGTCSAISTLNCGGVYRCAVGKCRASCAADSDCVPGAYCLDHACVARRMDGEVCSAGRECITGNCGGRCCSTGCSCTQPSAKNLLLNPAIDKDTSSWTIDAGILSRSSSDAEQCPYSGSLTTRVPAGEVRTVRQCANKPAVGLFNFGGHIKKSVVGAGVICQVEFWHGSNCGGDLALSNETNVLMATADWQSPAADSGPTQVNANSVSLSCLLFADSSSDTDFFLDMLYVSGWPDQF